jgi:phosphoribosyl 1,2-cyclic phosphodiesterase
MKVCSLGSGSKGNSTLIESRGTRILIDIGFSGKETTRRLHEIEVPPESIDAILITHDHRDHTSGAGIFSRRYNIPIYITASTLEQCNTLFTDNDFIKLYQPSRRFVVDGITVEPFLTLHDAVEPVVFSLTDISKRFKVGIATDLGKPTAQVRLALTNVDFLILESNYDEDLLRNSHYPATVQQRIASSHGHLSNRAAAQFACELLHPGLSGILLAHISQKCNRPDLALSTMEKAMRPKGFLGFLGVATQDRPTLFLDLEKLKIQTNRNGQYSLL